MLRESERARERQREVILTKRRSERAREKEGEKECE